MSGEDDLELKMKLLRMQRKLFAEKEQKETRQAAPLPEDPETIIRGVLRERGDEVLEAAKQQFPAEAKQVIEELAGLVKKGKISEISGQWLFSVLNQIGIPVRLKTTIQIVSGGKVGSIADKLKEK